MVMVYRHGPLKGNAEERFAAFEVSKFHGQNELTKELGLWGVNTCSDPRVITSGLVAHLKEEGLMASIALVHDAATAAAFAGHRPNCVVTRDRRTVKPIMDCGAIPPEEETGWIKGESAVLPPYNEKAGGWYAGYRPQAIRMWEIAARQTLLPETVQEPDTGYSLKRLFVPVGFYSRWNLGFSLIFVRLQ